MHLYLLAALLHAAIASPANAPNAAFCATVNRVVSVPKAQTAAAAFCSQYLHTLAQSTFVYTAGGRSVTCRDPKTVFAMEVRAASAKKPDCFKGYTKPEVIAAACRCISQPALTATSFRIVALGSFSNSKYARKNIIDQPPTVYFDSEKSISTIWTITNVQNNPDPSVIRGLLTAQDSSGGSAYLNQCGFSSGGPYCDGMAVLIGTASGTGSNGGSELNLDCDVVVNDGPGLCSLECSNEGAGDGNFAAQNNQWLIDSVRPNDGPSAFTPLIAPV